MTPIQDDISAVLGEWQLCHGIGDRSTHTACTIAAINLAITGELKDDRPACVSPVIHAWVRPVQDAMPLYMLRCDEWRELVPLIAGTAPASDEVEQARLDLCLGWMWERLAAISGSLSAAARPAWDRMLAERTMEAAKIAALAVHAYAAHPAATHAAADHAAHASADHAAHASADHAAHASAHAYSAAAYAARAARAACAGSWPEADPVGLLRALIDCGEADR